MAAATSSSSRVVESFGKLASGEPIEVVHLSNGSMTADVITYGANLASVKVPSATSSTPLEVTLNGTDLEDIVVRSAETFFGANPGRVANRIAKGRFQLEQAGKTVIYDKLAINNGENCLHGGARGFDKHVWTIVGEPTASGVTMELVSPDGDEGFPGKLTARIEFTLSSDNELGMTFTAGVTGASTIVNLCNHAYWNLSGDFASSIHDHRLWLGCDHFVETNPATLIPTGAVLPATGDLDFASDAAGVAVGPRLDRVMGGTEPGFDHCFCRAGLSPDCDAKASAALAGVGTLAPIARLSDPASGRTMSVATTQPGVQVYTGNFLPKPDAAGSVKPFLQHWAMCLETQHYPDAVNHPAFPPIVLNEGECYKHTTVHKFDW